MYKENSITGRLNQLYQESKLTREEFAKRCKISTSALTNYLKGSRTPDAAKLPCICEEFEVSADWLLGLSDVRMPSAEMRAVSEYINLPEDTVLHIKNYDAKMLNAFIRFIEHEAFDRLIETYGDFLDILIKAAYRFTPGTPGANIGVGMESSLSVQDDGSVKVSSIWQTLTFIGREMSFYTESIAEVDRLKLWDIGEEQNEDE